MLLNLQQDVLVLSHLAERRSIAGVVYITLTTSKPLDQPAIVLVSLLHLPNNAPFQVCTRNRCSGSAAKQLSRRPGKRRLWTNILLVRGPWRKTKQQIPSRLADSQLLCCRNERNGKETHQEVVIVYV